LPNSIFKIFVDDYSVIPAETPGTQKNLGRTLENPTDMWAVVFE
jgi:hypothetical protein